MPSYLAIMLLYGGDLSPPKPKQNLSTLNMKIVRAVCEIPIIWKYTYIKELMVKR